MTRGTVYGSEGGIYSVRLETGETVRAVLRGRLKKDSGAGDRVVIGDEVQIQRAPDGTATIEEVGQRYSTIRRAGPGGRRPKILAANVDRLIVVAAVWGPAPRQGLVDRLLVIGEANHLDPALVMNKMDLVSEGKLETVARRLVGLYRNLGYRVLETSARTGEGLASLKELLCQGTSVLVGPSGVGKSSLLNAVEPGLDLRTGELSHKQGGGRHTTVSARLLPLGCGGLVADTPGFSDAGVWGVEPQELEACFPEFHPFREECRFRGCTHLHEPGCAVQGALAEGLIHEDRFDSYRKLMEEAVRGSGK